MEKILKSISKVLFVLLILSFILLVTNALLEKAITSKTLSRAKEYMEIKKNDNNYIGVKVLDMKAKDLNEELELVFTNSSVEGIIIEEFEQPIKIKNTEDNRNIIKQQVGQETYLILKKIGYSYEVANIFINANDSVSYNNKHYYTLSEEETTNTFESLNEKQEKVLNSKGSIMLFFTIILSLVLFLSFARFSLYSDSEISIYRLS